MSASSQPQVPTSKLQDPDKDKKGEGSGTKEPEQTPATLEEDDEFEDFPVEGTRKPYLSPTSPSVSIVQGYLATSFPVLFDSQPPNNCPQAY